MKMHTHSLLIKMGLHHQENKLMLHAHMITHCNEVFGSTYFGDFIKQSIMTSVRWLIKTLYKPPHEKPCLRGFQPCSSQMADSSQFSPLNTLSDQLVPNSWVSSVFILAFIANIGKYFFLKYDRQSFKSI